jgi:SsrA-binding protein
MAKGADEKKLGDKQVARNRRAYFDYEIGETVEAGVVLIGSEVRSMRVHGADLSDAWVDVDVRGEAWVKGMRIPPLTHAAFGHEEKRTRKLLMHREQIARLRGAAQRDGMTLIVTRCYFRNNRAKVEVALARGKRKYDKRQAVRAREADREAAQAIRRGKLG